MWYDNGWLLILNSLQLACNGISDIGLLNKSMIWTNLTSSEGLLTDNVHGWLIQGTWDISGSTHTGEAIQFMHTDSFTSAAGI